MKLFGQMLENGVSPDVVTFSTLINGLCKTGKMEDAFMTCDEMSERDLVMDEVTYTKLVDDLCSSGFSKEATLISEGIMRCGMVPWH
ncbi:hypothetical protein MKX01_035083, partial [Papaver californicum]